MKTSDFLMCKFEGDSDRYYIADITGVEASSFTCKFVHSGSIYEFETTNWTVAKPGKTFPIGTLLTEHFIYTRSDIQNLAMLAHNESKLVCVTFEDNNRYLGHFTKLEVTGYRLVTFLHSGSKYVFNSSNVILVSGGAYKVGKHIKGIEVYVPAAPFEIDFPEIDGDVIEVRSGALHTDWKSYFENYTMEQMQDAIADGNVILKNMVDTTVAQAKLISHGFANPFSGEDLAKDALKAGLGLITGNAPGFILKASKVLLSGILGSFVEILRAGDTREISKTRRGLYVAYTDGCFSALFPFPGDHEPEDSMEKQFYALGFETVSNLTIRGLKDATLSEYRRGDLLAALAENYRLRPGVLREAYDLEEYKRRAADSGFTYTGLDVRLNNNHTRTDD